VSARSFSGNGSIPVGGIILWSGAINAIPSGWRLCDGGGGTPDLRDRFVVGAGKSYSPGNIGGATSVTLTVDNMPSHAHDFDDAYWSENDGYNYGWTGSHGGTDYDNHLYFWRHSTYSTGGNKPFDIRPPYYALAFIMRVN
jgi:hypothetical protein